MWPAAYDQRLRSWQNLRDHCRDIPKQDCLDDINQWWFRTPWTGYLLHWDDRQVWPDPWQLLQNNSFCSLARALGIMYTLSLLSRSDLQCAELIETENDNLVMIEGGKYVLNWEPDTIVNINPEGTNPRHRIMLSDINQLIL